MILDNRYTIMMSVGLVLALLAGCGSGASDTKAADNSGVVADDNNNTPNNENNNTDPVVVGYVAGNGVLNGVLIETKSDGTKLAWVNDTSTACLIYRIAQRGGTILDGGRTHCEGLDHGGITTWRMPTEDEAVYLMAHVPVNQNADQSNQATSNKDANFIIYPDDNPNCQFMATTTAGRYVYTTNNSNTGAFDDAARGTAGIRCVANQ